MRHRTIFVQRDWYPQLPARAAKASPPAAGLSQHNAEVLANQVRVSSGATMARGLMGENGRMVADRLAAVLPRGGRHVP